MRKPAFRKSVRGSQTANSYSVPAPVGGWNARDSVALMSEEDAVVMKNIFPETTETRVRRGQSEHVTDISDRVKSLMVYNAPDGTQELFAAADDDIYDVTTAGAVGSAEVSSLTSDKWQYVNFTNSNGDSYLCCFNGSDDPEYYNGTSWATITDTGSPSISGVTTSDLISAAVHKRRMWLVEVDSLKAWYLPVDSVGGNADAIDLGGIAYKGGYIMAIGSWTVDGGDGIDDYWACVTSEGQLIVYQGTDPTDATKWLLVGVWNIGEPLGRRCFCKMEGDLLVITVNGVISVSRIFMGKTDSRAALTDKINSAMTDASVNYRTNFGWELLYYAQANMLILNVPVNETEDQEQYVMNTITGSWGGPFEGVGAGCWAILDKEPYFGMLDEVRRFWNADDDEGSNIDFEERQAYTYLQARGVLKHIKSVRPSILASGTFSVLMGINVDFSDAIIEGSVSFTPPIYGVWDSGLWDNAIWGGGLVSFNDWQTVSGIGTAISVGIKGAVQGIEFRHAATDILYERGGVIA